VPSSDSPARAERQPAAAVFRLQLLLGGCGLTAMGAAVTATGESIHRRTVGAHRLAIDGITVTYPALNAAAAVLLVLALLGAFVLVTAAREAGHQLRASRQFLRRLPVVGQLPAHPEVRVVNDSAPEAFCAGFLRPRVYVSRGAVELLTPDELRAVLQHEHHHRRMRDPLRLASARVLSRALFFLPVLRPLHDGYAELAEVHADRAARQADAGGRSALAAALLAFDASAPPGASGISPHRVDSLLGTAPRWRPPGLLMLLAITTLAGLVVIVWRASQVASATATLNLPVLSSQPCILALALIPLAACLAASTDPRRGRPERRRPQH
jgi:Zn-dependent protease with chaperone function